MHFWALPNGLQARALRGKHHTGKDNLQAGAGGVPRGFPVDTRGGSRGRSVPSGQ